MIDLFPAGDFLRAYLATLRAAFPHVALMFEPPASASPWSDGPAETGRERATFVVVASAAPLPLDRLTAAPGAPRVVLAAEQFEAMVGAGGLVLTDDYAPVDGLTGRLFLARYQQDGAFLGRQGRGVRCGHALRANTAASAR